MTAAHSTEYARDIPDWPERGAEDPHRSADLPIGSAKKTRRSTESSHRASITTHRGSDSTHRHSVVRGRWENGIDGTPDIKNEKLVLSAAAKGSFASLRMTHA